MFNDIDLKTAETLEVLKNELIQNAIFVENALKDLSFPKYLALNPIFSIHFLQNKLQALRLDCKLLNTP